MAGLVRVCFCEQKERKKQRLQTTRVSRRRSAGGPCAGRQAGWCARKWLKEMFGWRKSWVERGERGLRAPTQKTHTPVLSSVSSPRPTPPFPHALSLPPSSTQRHVPGESTADRRGSGALLVWVAAAWGEAGARALRRADKKSLPDRDFLFPRLWALFLALGRRGRPLTRTARA